MNSDQFRQAAHASIEEIIKYYDTIQDRRVLPNIKPGYLRQLLPTAAPEQPEKWEAIQADIEAKIMPGMTHWQSPNFMAFFPSNATYPSMLGELFSAALHAPAFNWLCAPAVTELETIVLDWMATLLHLPACYHSAGSGGGVVHGSASEAVLTAMVAARERHIERATARLGGAAAAAAVEADLRGRLVALGSEQAHSCSAKAARVAGVRYRAVPTELADGLAMTGRGLREALAACRAEGLVPFYVTATLGTTATCAVDRFAEIRAVVEADGGAERLWVHVDAAYAGAALVCDEFAHLTAEFDGFDSFDMNMHKWLLTNFDASLFYVRQRRDLTSALSITPSYLRNDFSTAGLVTDYRDWQIPLGRRFRALKIWFVLRSYGASGLRAHIRDHIRLADLFHAWVCGRPDLFAVPTAPAFALTVLVVVPRGRAEAGREAAGEAVAGGGGVVGDSAVVAGDEELAAANRATREVYELINARGEIYLTSGVVNGIYAIRVVSGSPKTEEKYLRNAFEILVRTAEEVLAR